MVQRNTRHLTFDGKPWIGVNFWSAAGGPMMWKVFDPERVSRELDILAGLGLTATRTFCFWPDFHPEPYRIDSTMVERFRQFLDLHARHGLRTVPTFIVGGMSGANFDPAWRKGGNLYADGWLLARQADYIRTVTAGIADHPAIAGWLISNEMHFYGGIDNPEIIRSWAELMVQAVRAGGGRGPVSLGDGVLGSDLYGDDNGFRLDDLSHTIDWIGPHVYGMTDDVVRSHLLPAFKCELSGSFGRPVVLEEFGVTTNFASDRNAGQYYDQVLHSSLMAGATGFVAWNNTDFDLVDQAPYSHHPFEEHFGITTAQGELKEPARRLAAFAAELREIDLPRCRRADTECVLVVPGWVQGTRPGVEDGVAHEYIDILQQAYISARQAGLAPAVVREDDGIPPARLILVPCGRRLDGPTWLCLQEHARAGATVYVSYFSGSTPSQRGPWHPDFDQMFGIRHRLRYGLVNEAPETVTFELTDAIGDLAAGTTLTFPSAGTYSGRSYVPFDLTEARELARSGVEAAIAQRTLGEGRIILVAYPIEYFALQRPGSNPDDTSRLYRALAIEASALPEIDNAGDPALIVDVLERDDGAKYAIVISESDKPVTATVGGLTVTLEPYGATIRRVDAAAVS